MAQESNDLYGDPDAASQNTSAKAVFNSVGPAYENAFKDVQGQQDAIKWLVATLKPQSKVLDVGCGTGRPVCSSLHEAGHTVLGIDVSEKMLDFARKNVPGPLFAMMDVKEFEADPGAFDAITVFFSMLASFTQEGIRQQITNYYTWLRPGGLLVYATVPIPAESQQLKWMGRDVLVSSLSVEESIKAVEDAGFTVVQKTEDIFMPKGVDAGICDANEVWEEPHLFIHALKPEVRT